MFLPPPAQNLSPISADNPWVKFKQFCTLGLTQIQAIWRLVGLAIISYYGHIESRMPPRIIIKDQYKESQIRQELYLNTPYVKKPNRMLGFFTYLNYKVQKIYDFFNLNTKKSVLKNPNTIEFNQ